MATCKPLLGRFVTLKILTREDAQFMLDLRNDPKNGRFFPKFEVTYEQQIKWIDQEIAKDDEYTFIVFDKDDKRVGMLSIYAIEDGSCENGRLIMIGNPFQSIEAQYLVFKFAFEELGLMQSTNYIFANNPTAISFSNLFGVKMSNKRVNENGVEVYDGLLTKGAFSASEKRIRKMLYRE